MKYWSVLSSVYDQRTIRRTYMTYEEVT
jgi:hypothetical protein